MKKPSKANRTKKFIDYRSQGLTLQEIGKRCGVTATCVTTKLRKVGYCLYPSNPTNTGKKAKCLDNEAAMVELRNNGLNNSQIAVKLGISRERVRQVLARICYVGKPDMAQQRATPEMKAIKAQKNRAKVKIWKKANPEKALFQYRRYINKRVATDTDFRLRLALRNSLRVRLRRAGTVKSAKTMQLIGCTVPELKTYLANLFQPGMSWENWGVKGWHIDHIRPCASFDLTDPEQQLECFHFSNLQPLWAEDNLRKADKWVAA